MDMVKMKLDSKMYDIVSLEEYQANTDAFVPNYTAIRSADGKYALPVRGISDSRPGIYVTNCIAKENITDEMEGYELENAIDLSDAKTIGELLQKQEAVRDIEHEILTDVNNIFTPKIGPHDSAAIAALKQAVIDKHIDLDKYEPRFGSNYSNDKRILIKDKISMQMLVRVCNALDIKATLTLEDKSPDVPNPMNGVINVELTNGGSDDGEE